MKNILFILSIFILSISCGVRHTRQLLTSGNYDHAIRYSIENLRSNKNAKSKQDYVYLLEEAFAKAKERDHRNISILIKDANPGNFEKIFNTYQQLNKRQELIRPLLPLKLLNEGRNAIFPFEDYSDEIVSSKNTLSKFLYDNSKALISSNNKMDCRKAYEDLKYLNNINPNYKNVRTLIDEAQFKGTDFVNVYTKNETNMVIPMRLQNDLLDFSTLGLNDKWTVYHSNRQKDIDYDFGLIVNFRQINISPEQVREKQFINEKQIKDGVKNLLNANGQIVKDSLGNPIKVDNFKTVKASIHEITQFKACQVTAKVDFIDFRTNQLIDTFPLTSEFTFQHIHATFNGDKRACEQNYLPFFNNKMIPFPNNEQMVYDTGEDLKAKLKNIIIKNKFRKHI